MWFKRIKSVSAAPLPGLLSTRPTSHGRIRQHLACGLALPCLASPLHSMPGCRVAEARAAKEQPLDWWSLQNQGHDPGEAVGTAEGPTGTALRVSGSFSSLTCQDGQRGFVLTSKEDHAQQVAFKESSRSIGLSMIAVTGHWASVCWWDVHSFSPLGCKLPTSLSSKSPHGIKKGHTDLSQGRGDCSWWGRGTFLPWSGCGASRVPGTGHHLQAGSALGPWSHQVSVGVLQPKRLGATLL